MHMLFLLTAVLASHPLALETSVPAQLQREASLLLPASQEVKFHLLDTTPYEQSNDHGSYTRYFLEYSSGIGLGLAGMIVGLSTNSGYMRLKDSAVPAALGLLGSSVGVQLAGWALDGRGRFGFALLGSFIGFAAPLLVGTPFLVASGCDTRTIWDCRAMAPIIIGMFILSPLGATVAYELSAPTPWLSEDYALRAPRPAPGFVPVLTPARQGFGGTLGIAGRL